MAVFRCRWCGERHDSPPAFNKCLVCRSKLDQPYTHVQFLNFLRDYIGLEPCLNDSTRTTNKD